MLYCKILGITLAVVYLLVLLIYLTHKKILFKGLILNSASGLLLLAVLKLASTYFAFSVPINSVSVIGAAALGVPGVGLYFLINYLFL